PFEYLPIATRFVDRLSELARPDIPDIDMPGAVERAGEFQELARRLDAATAARRRTSTQDARPGFAGYPETQDLGGAEPAAERLNRPMLQPSRTPVPVASTVAGPYGQDRYGHAWQTQMIPTLTPYPRLAVYPRDSEEFQTWWVAMVRARNQVADSLE